MREGRWQLTRQRLFFALLLIGAIGNGGCSGGSGSQTPLPHQEPASSVNGARGAALRSHAMQFTAIALPTRFRPVAIMKDGAIPGSIGQHAAVFSQGTLTILKNYPGCTTGEQNYGFINTATSINRDGEVVGYCNYAGASQAVGIPLYYKNGKVKALAYTPESPTIGGTILSMSINDLGVIVGAINTPSEKASSLYRFYKGGTQATYLTDTYDFIETVNDRNEIANTRTEPVCGCYATITSIRGKSKIIFAYGEYLRSRSDWINDQSDVVGGYAVLTSGYGMQAYLYRGGVITYLPAPATEATGINNSGDIVGAETSGLFLYKNGILSSISSDIRPHRNYSVYTTDCAGIVCSYLGGLGDQDEFIVTAGGRFYLVTPNGNN